MLKDIVNLVEDVRYLLARFSKSKLKYYNKKINKDVDILVKMSVVICCCIFFAFFFVE